MDKFDFWRPVTAPFTGMFVATAVTEAPMMTPGPAKVPAAGLAVL
jgi:hypothetical protein